MPACPNFQGLRRVIARHKCPAQVPGTTSTFKLSNFQGLGFGLGFVLSFMEAACLLMGNSMHAPPPPPPLNSPLGVLHQRPASLRASCVADFDDHGQQTRNPAIISHTSPVCPRLGSYVSIDSWPICAALPPDICCYWTAASGLALYDSLTWPGAATHHSRAVGAAAEQPC